MIWSRYNTLFHSARFGFFLHNALSNALLEVDNAHFCALEKLRDHDLDPGRLDDRFFSVLREHKAMVAEGEEERILLSLQYRRRRQCFETSLLGLTICPTLRCNFRCQYCFELGHRTPATMTHETIERLLAFVKNYREIRGLGLAWYGGEPLIAFEVIREITEKTQLLSIEFDGAFLVTNGYLLDKRKCESLNDLKIHSVQITLDGLEEVHNRRRPLAGGGPTFARIVNNLDALMNSSYKGTCHIRINIDKQNAEQFAKLHAFLTGRFKGKRLFIYAGHVDTRHGHSYDPACSLGMREWTNFTLDMYRRGGLLPADEFYPEANIENVCAATAHNRFVIDPQGYLYKCWEDVGRPEMIIGDIQEAGRVTNEELQAQYSVGTDAFLDPECLACSVLPLCCGGCANKRLRAKQFGEKGLDFCSPYKDNLVQYLEGYIDTLFTREMCMALVSSTPQKTDTCGYRLISPDARAEGHYTRQVRPQ